MRCSRCGKEIAVKKIKGLGALCYWCFDLAVLKMLGIKEVWLEEEIIPIIKLDIAERIIKDDSFSVQKYVKDSAYGEETIKHAISDMLDLDMLAEKVRKVLNAYRGELLGEYFGEEE